MRAPKYETMVGPAQVSGARFQTQDNNGGAWGGVADGLKGFGGAVNDMAVAQDAANAQNDDTQARALLAEAQLSYGEATTEYGSMKAGAARENQEYFRERLEKIRQETLDRAGTGRQRQMLEERISGVHGSSLTAIGKHAIVEQQAERAGVLGAQEASTIELAGSTSDPAVRDALVSQAIGIRHQRLIEIEGISPEDNPDMFQMEALKVTNSIHEGAISRMLASPDPDVDEVVAYVEAYGDEMTLAGRTDVMKSLQQPLQDRADEADLRLAMSGSLPAAASEPGQGTEASFSFSTPVKGGTVTSRFGVSRGGGKSHSGLDIAGAIGSGINPIAQGTVTKIVPASEGGDAGNWVEVTHPDGTTSTYSHMGAFSVKKGDPVGADTVLGTIGMTGHTTGPHVHLVTRNAAGERVDPEKMIGTSASGTVLTGNDTPREWDRDQVYNNIDNAAEAGGWSFEKTERVKRRADRVISRDESLLGEKRKDAARAAAEIVGPKGDDFTSVNVIPKSVRDAMDPLDLIDLEQTARKNREARSATAPKGQRWTELQILKRTDPAAFAAIDPSKEIGKMAGPEIQQMMLDQATIIGKDEAGQEVQPYRTGIGSAITWGKKYKAVEVPPEDFPAVHDTMESYLKGLGRKPTKDDYDTAFDIATREINTVNGVFGYVNGSKPLYKVDEVPSGDRARIIRNWRGSKPPTEGQILQAWRVYVGQK